MRNFKKLLAMLLSVMLLLSVCIIPGGMAVSAETNEDYVAFWGGANNANMWWSNDYMTEWWEDGLRTRHYDPTSVYYNGGVAHAGPYADISAGYWRLDVQIALTGKNFINAITGGTKLFDFQVTSLMAEPVYVTVGDLAPDTNGDGWQTYSCYIKADSNVSGVEFLITNLKDVGLKIGNYYLYASNEEEYNAYSPIAPVHNRYVKDGKQGITGLSVSNNEMVYTAADNTSPTYWGTGVAGHYLYIPAGTYRFEADIAVSEALSNAGLFNFGFNSNNGKVLADNYIDYPDNNGRDEVKYADIKAGEPYVCYFTTTADDAWVEPYFFFSAPGDIKYNVDLSIGEMRVYAVDSVPEVEEKENAVWVNWAKDLAYQGTGVSVNGNKLVYTAANGTHNYWERNTYGGTTLAAGTYRLEADMTVAEALSNAEIFNFEIAGGNAADGYSDTDGRDFVRRSDIEDGAPYVFYFTVAETSGVEFCFHFSGTGSKNNVDLSIGEMRVYAVDSVPEVEEKEYAIWANWAKDLPHQGTGVSVNGNKLVYTAANGTHNYWERNTYSGTTLAAGTYRFEADMTIGEVAPFEEIFNFEIVGGKAADGYSDTDGRDFVRRGDIEDGKPYVFYFTMEADGGVEFCFHFSGTASKCNVDLSIGEIRVYAVDSVPEVSFEVPVWSGYAGTNLNNDASASIIKSGNETEYDPTIAVDSKNVVYGPYKDLTNGYYRVDVEVALTGKNAIDNITEQNIFAIDVTSNYGNNRLHNATACTVTEVSSNGKYAVISRYFKVADETATAVELHIATWNGGNVGFKIRGVAFYKIDEFVFGDLNGEGNGNTSDLIILRKLLLGTVSSVACESDLNGDGETNIIDLIVMKKYLANGYWEPPVATVFYTNFKTADTVYYIENTNITRAERDMLMSLQGIVAKEKSQIYIKTDSETEEFEQLKNEYGINMIEVTKPWDLVDRFKNKISDNGFVKYTTYYYEHDYTDNPDAPESINVAAVIAGQENYLMVDDSLVEEAEAHGLTEKICALDYTSETIFAKYKDTINKKIYVSINNVNHALYDVAIALGCMVYRGELMEDFLAQMDPDGLVLGWYDNELSSVGIASKYGYSTLAMDGFVNGTVTAGLKRVSLKQKATTEYVDNSTDVHYVTFIMSDGDNLNYDKAMATSGHYFDVENRGSIPFGWSLNPGVYEWLPNTAKKLYTDMTNNDYFVASVSGYGYMLPNLYPTDYLDDYVKRTEEYMKKTNMNYITLASNNSESSELDSYIPYFAASNQILGGHFNDMSAKSECYVHSEYGGGVVWYNDKPFIYDREALALDWQITKDRRLTISDAISQMAYRINNVYERNINSIEGYTIINVHPWSVTYDDCINLVEQFNDDVVVVTPKEFFELVTENVPHTDYLDMADKNMTYGLQNVYTPADTTNYNADHLTVQNDDGTNVLVYDPTVTIDSSSSDKATVYGPYKSLDAGCYRADFEVALTGNDNTDYITDNTVIFAVEINGETSYITKSDLAEDSDGDGYFVYTKYFKLDADTSEVEYRVYADGGMIGFKIREIYTYDATQEQYDTFASADTLVVRFNAADRLNIGNGFTVTKDSTNGTMTFGGSGWLDAGNVLYGPYMSLSAGNYRVEVDVAVNGATGSSSKTLFELQVYSSGTTLSDTLDITEGSLGSIGANDFNVVSLNFSTATDLVNSFELQFSVPGLENTAGFIVREIRIYNIG